MFSNHHHQGSSSSSAAILSLLLLRSPSSARQWRRCSGHHRPPSSNMTSRKPTAATATSNAAAQPIQHTYGCHHQRTAVPPTATITIKIIFIMQQLFLHHLFRSIIIINKTVASTPFTTTTPSPSSPCLPLLLPHIEPPSSPTVLSINHQSSTQRAATARPSNLATSTQLHHLRLPCLLQLPLRRQQWRPPPFSRQTPAGRNLGHATHQRPRQPSQHVGLHQHSQSKLDPQHAINATATQSRHHPYSHQPSPCNNSYGYA